MELFTGNLYFATHDSYEHLAMIEKSQGKIPDWMVENADKSMRKYFRF